MARGLAGVLEGGALTTIVNVGDDQRIHGVHVSADVDTVMYTLAGIEGPEGWGLDGDTFELMDRLAALGADTRFRLGDRDFANCLYRTMALDGGGTLTSAVDAVTTHLGINSTVLPATNDELRTKVKTTDGRWLDFQDYFVLQRHEPDVAELRYEGAESAVPAPGVVRAIAAAELVVIAPSNPPLSIWPVLAIPGIRGALATKRRVIAVSPLIGGAALKGPANRVMHALGLPPGTAGVLEAYEGLLTDLFIDRTDAADEQLGGPVAVRAADTLIRSRDAAERLASEILALVAA